MAPARRSRRLCTRATLSAISAFSAISWGIIAPLFLLAPDLVTVFASGPHWHEAVPIFRALLPFVLIRGSTAPWARWWLATGRPRVLTMVSRQPAPL